MLLCQGKDSTLHYLVDQSREDLYLLQSYTFYGVAIGADLSFKMKV